MNKQKAKCYILLSTFLSGVCVHKDVVVVGDSQSSNKSIAGSLQETTRFHGSLIIIYQVPFLITIVK